MRIYCSITGSRGSGPTSAQNRAALEALYTQGHNWRAEIGAEEPNVSCIIYTDNGHTTEDFKQAVEEAYGSQKFQYFAYLASVDNKLVMPQVSATEESRVGDGDSNEHSIPLVIPTNSPFNVEAKKYFVFNTTGNIMMVSTNEGGQMAESVREVFEEVSVFFAAMTKAITNTPNPNNNNKPYSLYNYEALEKVIAGSGLFIHITEEDIHYETHSFGASFGIELIEGLLGLAIGEGALSFAQSMLSSMGSSALKIDSQSESENKKIANIIFICEYLLGMPAISAIVVYLDTEQVTSRTDIGPCYSTESVHSTWKLHKDTYMFVTPKFIKEYSGDLDSAAGNLDYNIFVDYLKALVTGKADIVGLTTADGQKAPIQLNGTDTYYIVGANFGDNQGDSTISFGSSSHTQITPAGWSDNLIGFTLTGDQVRTATPINLTIRGDVYNTSGVTFRGTNPLITGVIDLSTGLPPKNSILKQGTNYELVGVNFGNVLSTMTFATGVTVTPTPNSWKDGSIKFTVSGSTAVQTPTKVHMKIGATTYNSPGTYVYAPSNTPLITGVYSGGTLAGTTLKKNTTYTMKGTGFGTAPKTMTFGTATIAPLPGAGNWTDGSINFTVAGASVTTPTKIGLTLGSHSPKTLSQYTFGSTSTPTPTGVYAAATGGSPITSNTALTSGTTYYIQGTNLGTSGTLIFKDSSKTATITSPQGEWKDTHIAFIVSGQNDITTASHIKVQIGSTPYTVPGTYTYTH